MTRIIDFIRDMVKESVQTDGPLLAAVYSVFIVFVAVVFMIGIAVAFVATLPFSIPAVAAILLLFIATYRWALRLEDELADEQEIGDAH